ncbi:MAG: pyruvate kinase [Anaerolineae bacterium]|nr:pyruvate kinase [Anaerolineae bacterium]
MPQRTRIVCTLGPASDSDDAVRALIRAGMDVARLNFSHGDHTTHRARIERVRRIAREENAIVALLGDLQGPKIRVGEIPRGAMRLVPGATLTLTTRAMSDSPDTIRVDFDALPQAVQPGGRILLADGLMELQVIATSATDVQTRVITGGELTSRKGINLPGASLQISALTEKDRADVAFAIEHDLDYLALSFVRCAEDVMTLRQLLQARGANIPIIAKIEKPEAVEHVDAILEASDGVMVARGDLGVEVAAEQVPLIQKTIIRKANALGKPVITATQMLESMIENPRPTRAEASDVANAILDGTDAVMLSGETAIGKYPIEAAQTMARIADAVEASRQFEACARKFDATAMSVTDAIGNATCEIAEQVNAKLIITATFSGYTARMIARHRPLTRIFAVTANEKTQRQLALVWGIHSALITRAETLEDIITQSIAAAQREGFVQVGDRVVITGGVPAGFAGRTNMIQVRVVGESQ